MMFAVGFVFGAMAGIFIYALILAGSDRDDNHGS